MLKVIFSISILLILVIALNLSPYLLGPAPYPPDWRWTYEFSNTFSKIWCPLIVIFIIFLLAYKTEKSTTNNKKNSRSLLVILLILGFALQLSLLFYGRAGLGVLVHRIINPLISGYFSSSLSIQSISGFFHSYNQNLGGYPMYGRFHPPGAILFFYLITAISHPFASYFSHVLSFTPSHSDVALIWKSLDNFQRFSALVSGILIAFIANLTMIPIYLSSKLLYGEKTALRSIFMFLLIPSILLFTPLNDVFIPFFTAFSLYFFLKGIKYMKHKYFFVSGIVFFAGLLFSLTFLPLLLFFGILYLVIFLQKQRGFNSIHFKLFGSFMLGFLVMPILLFFYGFNFLQTTRQIMEYHVLAQSGRKYGTWFFYNIYDFLLFAGIPLSLLFIYFLYDSIKSFLRSKFKFIQKIDPLFVAFICLLFAVEITGTVRAETARIWTPYIPIFVIIVANFITDKLKIKRRQFLLLLMLLATQVLVFQTVLVTIW